MGSFGFVLPAVERASELSKPNFNPVFITDSTDDRTGLAWVRLVKTYQSRWTGSDLKKNMADAASPPGNNAEPSIFHPSENDISIRADF